jgi:hypothetical protein
MMSNPVVPAGSGITPSWLTVLDRAISILFGRQTRGCSCRAPHDLYEEFVQVGQQSGLLAEAGSLSVRVSLRSAPRTHQSAYTKRHHFKIDASCE